MIGRGGCWETWTGRVSIMKILGESHWQLELISDAYVEWEARSMVRKQKKG